MTSAIDRLETRALLHRVISKRDRRSYGLTLTRRGRHIREEHKRVYKMIAARVMEALGTESEQQAMIDLLLRIRDRFNSVVPRSQ